MDEPPRDALENVEFLTASPVRLSILDALVDDPAEPGRLERCLDVPRSTLRRNLSELVDRSYVAHRPTRNEYELTEIGDVVRSSVREIVETVGRAESLIPFLERFPCEVPVPTETLLRCEITTADADAPYDPVSVVTGKIAAVSEAHGFLPTINPVYLDTLETLIDRDVSVTVIAPLAAYEALKSGFDDAFTAVVDADNVSLYASEEVPDYAAGFGDETVLLGVFDEHMRTYSVLRTSAPSPVYEWASDRYDRVAESATPYDDRE